MLKNMFVLALIALVLFLGARTILTEPEKEQINTIVHKKVNMIKNKISQSHIEEKGTAGLRAARNRPENNATNRGTLSLASSGGNRKRQEVTAQSDGAHVEKPRESPPKASLHVSKERLAEQSQKQEGTTGPFDILSSKGTPKRAKEELSARDIERVLGILNAAKKYLKDTSFYDDKEKGSKSVRDPSEVSRIKKKLSTGLRG